MSERGQDHPRHGIDPVVHSPVRFSILAYLRELEEADFVSLRDAVEVSDSTLSQHLSALVERGYVVSEKRLLLGRRRTCVAITTDGLGQFERTLAALRAIAGEEPGGAPFALGERRNSSDRGAVGP